MADKIILFEEKEKAEKKAKALRHARHKACALIVDAKNRYVKEKTRARSKKAAEEKNAIINGPRYKCLEDYQRYEDIRDAYGWDCITESECDRLEALWDEREQLKKKTVDGIYTDEVTTALAEAWAWVDGLWEDEITVCDVICREFKKQKEEAETNAAEWMKRQNEEYERLFGGKS